MNIDISTLGFIGLMTLGAVNVATMIKPNLSSGVKFMLSIAIAFALTYVPIDLQNDLLSRAKEAIQIGLSFSGVYKLAQKVGGTIQTNEPPTNTTIPEQGSNGMAN